MASINDVFKYEISKEELDILTRLIATETSPNVLKAYTNATLPVASVFEPGTMIWNSDENKPLFSDGTAWRTANGTLT